nr:vinorine synthase-like [Ipomoea batatas]
MKVEVVSKEMVRPSSPTPESLKTYKLSFMDQLAFNVRIPFVLFYDSSGDDHTNNTIDELKKSLSKTLSLMYPLAGRAKEDRLTVECNDEGVEFIVADVAENMCCLLDNPEMEKIRQLTPSAKVYEPQPVGKVLLAVQVNRFSCGGIAIGCFVSHAILDGSTLAKFLETWASFNRGCAVNNGGNGFISSSNNHSTILFPPLTDTSALERSVKMAAEAVQQEEKHMVVKRFVIPANAIAQLREELISAKDGTAAQLVRRIRDSLRAVNDGAARKVYGEGGLLRAVFARGDEMVRSKDSSTLYTSSLCRMPYYEIDFGWGKPRLAVSMVKNSTVLFLDAINGGVEVWMGLPKQLMHTLTQDHHFLAYVSDFPKPKL